MEDQLLSEMEQRVLSRFEPADVKVVPLRTSRTPSTAYNQSLPSTATAYTHSKRTFVNRTSTIWDRRHHYEQSRRSNKRLMNAYSSSVFVLIHD